MDQHLVCLALFALSTANFAFCADLTRVLLKRQRASAAPGVWVMRALSFAGLGSAYLCSLHCQSGLATDANFPGLQEAAELLKALEHRQALQRMEDETADASVIEDVLRALHFMAGLHDIEADFLVEQPDLQAVRWGDFLCLLQPPVGTASTDNDSDGGLPALLLRNIVAFLAKLVSRWGAENKSILSLKARLIANAPLHKLSLRCKERPDMLCGLTIFELIRRLFYEAQVLFLESMWRSADVKYRACTALIQILTGRPDLLDALMSELHATINDIESYLMALLRACKQNIDSCLARRHLPTPAPRCAVASGHRSRAEQFRESHTAFRTHRLSTALDELDDLLPIHQGSAFVANYVGPVSSSRELPNSEDAFRLQSLSQLFISGIALMPLCSDAFSPVALASLLAPAGEGAKARIQNLLRIELVDKELLVLLNESLWNKAMHGRMLLCPVNSGTLAERWWLAQVIRQRRKILREMKKCAADRNKQNCA